jgi:hypothetical protein
VKRSDEAHGAFRCGYARRLQSLANPGGIYRIAVSGSDGTVAFLFSERGDQTNELGIWKYPRGGPAMHIIKKIGQGDSIFGPLTVSVGAPRLRRSER